MNLFRIIKILRNILVNLMGKLKYYSRKKLKITGKFAESYQMK